MVFVGIDAGATCTRSMAISAHGEILGVGSQQGANPNAYPPAIAAQRVAQAVTNAMASHPLHSIKHLVLGIAGATKFTDPSVHSAFVNALAEAGIRCEIQVVTDAEAAFASGTHAPSGTVLIAGTGSMAGRINDHRLVATIGGFGWLLGDEGSAFWLGRQAVKAVLRQIEARAQLGRLGNEICTRFELNTTMEPPQLRQALLAAVHAQQPIQLAELAELVTKTAETDPLAAELVQQTAVVLADMVLSARTDDELKPIVITGSLATTANPVSHQLRQELLRRQAGRLIMVNNGALGAAWLAARMEITDASSTQVLHDKLLKNKENMAM